MNNNINLTYSKFEIKPPFLFRQFCVKITLLFPVLTMDNRKNSNIHMIQ